MYNFLSKKILSLLMKNGVIKDEYSGIYLYGIESFIGKSFFYLSVFIIAIISSKLLFSLVFILTYMFLRQYSGGYHCKTAERCYLFSMFIYISSLFYSYISSNFHEKIFYLELVIFVISAFMIIKLSPIVDANKPLEKEEVKKYKFITIITVVIYLVLYIIFNVISNVSLHSAIFCSLCAVSALMIYSKTKELNRYEEKDIKSGSKAR